MGIDVYVFDFLLKFAAGDLGDALCLGRQGLHLSKNNGQWLAATEILARHDPLRQLEELKNPDGYAETFLTYLGCKTIRSLDYSPFEGAQIICDLNEPVPKGLWDRFDLIIDGGTLEHIFDVPAAIRNVKRMLRPGGLFLSINAANNQLGHGLYQFSPELFWRAFAPEMGFAVEKMQLVPHAIPPAPLDLTDPNGRRKEMAPSGLASYLMVAARRTRAGTVTGGPIYQSDYAAGWKAHGR